MKSLKKTLVLLVVFSMILSAVMPAFAATDIYGLDCEEEVARLEALKVVSGYEDGTFGPENTITRAEMAVILCKMVGIDTVTVEENANVPSKFSDVKAGEWYTGYVNVAAGKGLLSGFPDGTFRPSEQLTMNQVLTLCVNALGRGEYVAEMGTWPANYIAEATKLGLLDGVKTSDANRGNVAIIVWNTLEAPAVWDVTGTEYSDGSINLSNSQASLLSIYFRNYTTKAGDLKEITIDPTEVTVAFNDNFIEIPEAAFNDFLGVNDTLKKMFDFRTKVSKEETYFADSTVYVYVPEEVFEDIDVLEGNAITILLGEDNIAVAIIVEEEVEGNDLLTAYENKAKEKITIGGTKYTLSDKGYNVKLNDTVVNEVVATYKLSTDVTPVDGKIYYERSAAEPYTYTAKPTTQPQTDGLYEVDVPAVSALKTALTTLIGIAEDDLDNIEKVIEATVTLDGDDDVKAISLKTSATIPGYSIETVVEKVRESSSTYKITTKDGNISWDLDDEEDDEIEFPKVYIDGAKGDIRDIAEGNVLTVYTTAADLSDIEALDKIYVSTNTVAGNPSRITKADNSVRIDGTYYAPSALVEDNTTTIMTTDDLKDGNWVAFKSTNILKNEEVTLYLNMYGEYVAIALEEVSSEYTFGIVTYIASAMTTSGEEEEYQEAKIRVLLEDGSKKYYTLSLDTSDEDLIKDLEDNHSIVQVLDFFKPTTGVQLGDFVMFEANGDNKIVVEDENAIVRLVDKAGAKVATVPTTGVLEGNFIFGTTAALSDGEFDLSYGISSSLQDVEYDAKETIIFNLKEKEVVSKWEAILNNDETAFKEASKTFIIFEDKEADVAKYIVTCCDYSSSDAIYAIGGSQELYQDENDENKFYADLVGKDDLVEFTAGATDKEVKANWVVEYAMSSNKIANAFSIINVKSIFDKNTKFDTAIINNVVDFSTRTSTKKADTALLTVAGTERLEQIQLKEIAVKSNDDYKLKFVEIEDVKIGNVDVSEKVKVYELSYANGEAAVEEIDMDDLMTRVEEGVEDIFAIPCKVGTTNPDHVLFVFAN